MLSGQARRYMFRAPWMAIWPGLCLSIVVWGMNMFGDGLRDVLDPRLRGGLGKYGGYGGTSREKLQALMKKKLSSTIGEET